MEKQARKHSIHEEEVFNIANVCACVRVLGIGGISHGLYIVYQSKEPPYDGAT